MGDGDMMAALGRRAGRAAKLALRGSLLGAVLVIAASCTETPKQSMPCPVVKTVPDAAYVTRFAGESEDLTDTAFEARIVGVQPMCKYTIDTEKDKRSIT